MEVIRAPSNPWARRIERLSHSARDRREARQTILEGVHLIQEALIAGFRLEAVVVSEGAQNHPEVSELLARHQGNGKRLTLSDSLFRALAPVHSPLGVLALMDWPAEAPLPESGGVFLLIEGLQDPGNLGTLLRSAAATGVKAVLLSAGCAQLWSPKVLRGAMGAHFHLELHEQVDLLSWAKGYRGVLRGACLRDAVPYDQKDWASPEFALAVGNEGGGLSAALLDRLDERVCIPMRAAVESLNVGVAGSVLLFEHARQARRGCRDSDAQMSARSS